PYGSPGGVSRRHLAPGECRADSAFLSADWRPTVAAPGGQEQRCPPYESEVGETAGRRPLAGGKTPAALRVPRPRQPATPRARRTRTTLSALRIRGRGDRRAAAFGGRKNAVRPTGHQAESAGDTSPPANVGRTALSCPPTGARP